MEEIKIKDTVCKSCDGSGVYSGMGESEEAGIVCYHCNGSGKVDIDIAYEKFHEKKFLKRIKRIYETNPGIGIGSGSGFSLEAFGGMDYKDWVEGNPFPEKSEMRKYTCPAWWCQSANNKSKPKWDECISCGKFSECVNFKTKESCWERFDKEQK